MADRYACLEILTSGNAASFVSCKKKPAQSTNPIERQNNSFNLSQTQLHTNKKLYLSKGILVWRGGIIRALVQMRDFQRVRETII